MSRISYNSTEESVLGEGDRICVMRMQLKRNKHYLAMYTLKKKSISEDICVLVCRNFVCWVRKRTDELINILEVKQ